MKKNLPNILILMLVFFVLYQVFSRIGSMPHSALPSLAYSDFIEMVRDGEVVRVDIKEQNLHIKTKDGHQFEAFNPDDPHLIDDLLAADVKIQTHEPEKPSMLTQIFISWFPILLLITVWMFFMRRSQKNGGMGGMGGGMQFGKSKAKMLEEDKMLVTFNDVAGCEEAKEEVEDLVDFLKDPAKFQKLGGLIPKGLLMAGPPGTGKTLLARAIAGEAKVKFFSTSGSDFVEMFVGVGASRVRDMFAQAKEHAPCIIFIDEIDAVGRQRGAGNMGGNDEREQTLNQLLVEMDGFEGNEGVIVIAATNRSDILDKALLRPGRFDREVSVGLPDVRGREQILNVHIKKVPVGADVELKYIARGTPGFSGAELANVVNEAALMAARANKREVTMAHLEKAKDKMLMGAEKHSMIMSEEDKLCTAYHEAGHCIVGRLVPDHDPVYKVSIMPRGRALGITMFLPERDQFSASKRKLESQVSSLFGGRLAELLIFGDDRVTTGASNDIERATQLARDMVTKWGLSNKVGPLAYAEEQSNPYQQSPAIAPNAADLIDDEVRSVIDRNYKRAEQILKDNMEILHKMSDALMKWETIDTFQIDDLMAGRVPGPPQGYNDFNDTDTPDLDKKSGQKDDLDKDAEVIPATTNTPAGSV